MYESIQFETTCPFSRSHINCFKIDFHDFFSRVYTKSLGLPLFQILSWLLFHIPMMIQAGTLTKKKKYIYQYTYRLQEYIKQVYCLPELVFFLSSQIGTKMILLNQIKIRNSLWLKSCPLFFLFFNISCLSLLQLEVQTVCDPESYGHVDRGYFTGNVWFYCWAGGDIALEGEGKKNILSRYTVYIVKFLISYSLPSWQSP